MEVCVDSIESAVNGANGGASRLELCSALSEGGLTPSLGTLAVIKKMVDIPVFCMIRPRGGYDFIYSDHELDIMKTDIKHFKEEGADGFVFGCLTEDRSVDEKSCQILLEYSAPLPVTFHRAFDVVADPFTCLETIIQLGFVRILTSGTAETAEKGIPILKDLIKAAEDRIIIVPGGGVNEFNLRTILEETNATEFHGSAKTFINQISYFAPALDPYADVGRLSIGSERVHPMRYVTDIKSVIMLVKIYQSIIEKR